MAIADVWLQCFTQGVSLYLFSLFSISVSVIQQRVIRDGNSGKNNHPKHVIWRRTQKEEEQQYQQQEEMEEQKEEKEKETRNTFVSFF